MLAVSSELHLRDYYHSFTGNTVQIMCCFIKLNLQIKTISPTIDSAIHHDLAVSSLNESQSGTLDSFNEIQDQLELDVRLKTYRLKLKLGKTQEAEAAAGTTIL